MREFVILKWLISLYLYQNEILVDEKQLRDAPDSLEVGVVGNIRGKSCGFWFQPFLTMTSWSVQNVSTPAPHTTTALRIDHF